MDEPDNYVWSDWSDEPSDFDIDGSLITPANGSEDTSSTVQEQPEKQLSDFEKNHPEGFQETFHKKPETQEFNGLEISNDDKEITLLEKGTAQCDTCLTPQHESSEQTVDPLEDCRNNICQSTEENTPHPDIQGLPEDKCLEDESSDEIPLAVLARKISSEKSKSLAEIARKGRKRLWSSDIEMSDDSCNDKDYNSLKDTVNSTDTEDDGNLKSSKEGFNSGKRHQKVGARKTNKNKHLKKRRKQAIQTNLNREVNCSKLRSKFYKTKDSESDKAGNASRNYCRNEEKKLKRSAELRSKIKQAIYHKRIGRCSKNSVDLNNIERAKRKSLVEARIHSFINKYHLQRLDNLLASNGLKRSIVESDGNCFFKAVCKSTGQQSSSESLRQKVIDHIEQNRNYYTGFVETEGSIDFDATISQLRTDGIWNVSLADCLPLAVANLFKQCIRIYSSRIENPIQDIQPDLLTENDSLNDTVINIAHIAVRGREHYDAVVTIQDINQIECEPIIATPVKQPEIPLPSVTPHKPAKYVSPKKKRLYRRKQATPSEWKCNKKKKARNFGKSYINCSGKAVNERQVKPVNCIKCRYKCSEKITEEDRKSVFSTYWGFGDYVLQRNFICHHVENKPVKGTGTRKKTANSYFFTISESRIRVCKTFFLKTLDVGQKTVTYALKNKQCGTFQGTDKRGKCSPGNETPDPDIHFIKKHIESFPKMDSHYTRKNTKKQYLAADLNIRKMWQLYVKKCKEMGKNPVSEKKYRDVFCTNHNLSFYHPKKDQCSICCVYKSKVDTGTLTQKNKEDYENHQKRKTESREEKEKDKLKAQQDKSYHVATFDLQAVLSCPSTPVGELYYKRKLSCYNLSFYSLGNKSAVCYMWNETEAQRGSCEVGTCLLTYIKSVASASRSHVKEITFYSDTCSGQNRNKFVSSALLHTLHDMKSLDKVNQKFFERRHSQMESDSIHSTIENAKGKTEIYQPSQWNTVVRMARRQKPYMVIPMKYRDIKDFKWLSKEHCPNMKIAVNGTRVQWLNVKWIQVRRDRPGSVFVNYSFNEDAFLEVKVAATTRKRGNQKQWPDELPNRYEGKQPISVAKKNDLLSLCTSCIIPEEHHAYYRSLQTTSKAKDNVPYDESDENDTDDE